MRVERIRFAFVVMFGLVLWPEEHRAAGPILMIEFMWTITCA
jgi:hypothetical protein